MSHNQDQPYIERVLNGDTKAFSILVDRYKHMVFTLALKILRDREEAEEVAQDTFLKAFQVLKGFKGDSKFSTWIYKITYNKSLDYLKKQKRGREISSSAMYEDLNFQSTENTWDNLEYQDKQNTIKNAIDKLSGDDAVMITLFYYEELSLKEISKILKITLNAAKVKLFRSRNRLAEILKNSLEPEIIEGYGKK